MTAEGKEGRLLGAAETCGSERISVSHSPEEQEQKKTPWSLAHTVDA